MRLAPCLILLAVSGLGCTSQRIFDLKDRPLPTPSDGSALEMPEIQRAILKSCNQRDWSANVQGDGLITASLLVRQYSATVRIEYTARTLSVTYQDSENLNHWGDSIHRNYNRWVLTLYRTIMRNLGSHAQNF
jgi:hypothetical protein